MADTYSQIYIHIVFAVKGRLNLISPRWKDELYKYITGIITNDGQKLIAINGMPNHIYILIGLKPTIALSDLVRDIKASSSKFINTQKWIAGKFEWQHGFGAFSCGHSQLTKVINYIQNQEEHHKTKTFREEYLEFLKLYNVDFKEEFIFEEA
ncbi:IS200/IS605 family transposase [Flavobacterium album]|uniref:IS200/IS605 family transposase n=1 Tax=Flavobacterium album TaxID=2175091 RepID=A0A2S1QWG0_9FLAO|nr:IS200/IS605 family transposase [Flavobacterium album]AWH84571.1 IS200/IS605 family transposase [Flavobacterium album]